MELLLTNGQKIVTMDYIYDPVPGGVDPVNDKNYIRQNTYISSLWCGPGEDIPGGEIEYNLVNGSKIVIKYFPSANSTSMLFYDKNGVEVGGVAGSGNVSSNMFYLTTNNFHNGEYEPDEYGKKTLGGNAEVYNIADIPQQTGNNQPIMVEMVGRGYQGYAYNDPRTSAAFQGVTHRSTNINYVTIVEGSEVPSDPYYPGGNTKPGGGTGTFDDTSEPIDIPALPTLSAADVGFITLFNPSIPQLQNLASYMWSDLFDVNGWKKVFADPMQAILGLSIVPVDINSPTVKEVKVGNISTGVQMSVASNQYVEVDCGTLNIEEYWGSYLDYDPHTKAEIYLPYCGIHPLAVDDIMKKAVHVVYHVDILSGSCCAYIKCGQSVLYSFVGQCSSSVPITGDNWTNVINGALSIAASVGSMVTTGGASAPMAISAIASTSVNSLKPSVGKSGAMGGTGGLLAVQKPYVILTRPRQALPKEQNNFLGYPSFITVELAELSGYTEIEQIHLENIPATEQELNEIDTLLKGGVLM